MRFHSIFEWLRVDFWRRKFMDKHTEDMDRKKRRKRRRKRRLRMKAAMEKQISSAMEKKTLTARDMLQGQQYIHSLKLNKIRVAEYDRPSSSGSFAIMHKRGDLDFQSQFGIALNETVKEVSDFINEDGFCPACGFTPEHTNNPDNPVCRVNDWVCSCGWMGRNRP